MNLEEFTKYLQDYVINYYDIKNVLTLEDIPWQKVEEYAEPFTHDSWNLGKDYTNDQVSFSVKYPYGLVEYKLRTKEGKIDSLYIQGDYFENKDVEILAAALIGKELDREVLEKALDDYQISDYVNGMDKETLINDLLKINKEA